MKKVNLFLIPVAITAFAITSCGNKEISKEEAGTIVKKAAEREVPTYTTITLTTEIVKYKVEFKGDALDGMDISEEELAAELKALGFEEVKPGAKIEASITMDQAREQYRYGSLDEILSALDAASTKDSKIKYYAVGEGVKVEYSYSLESNTEIAGNKLSVSASTYSSATINEYALATELYSEAIQSTSTTLNDKTSSAYIEFGLRMALSFK